MFCLFCLSFCPVTSVFLLLRKNTERISIKFEGNHYCINRLGDNILCEIGTGCDNIFVSTLLTIYSD